MKKKIFMQYADAVAEQFHLSLDQMFEKSKRRECIDTNEQRKL